MKITTSRIDETVVVNIACGVFLLGIFVWIVVQSIGPANADSQPKARMVQESVYGDWRITRVTDYDRNIVCYAIAGDIDCIPIQTK